jgi:hypothetical protein
MSTSCMFELQKAMYRALTADEALMAMLHGGVFTYVPQGTKFPYVVLGEASAKDYSTSTSLAEEIIATLMVFSRERGNKEVLDCLSCIRDVLHGAHLPLQGCVLVNLRFASVVVTRMRETMTWQGNIAFRAVVEEV